MKSLTALLSLLVATTSFGSTSQPIRTTLVGPVELTVPNSKLGKSNHTIAGDPGSEFFIYIVNGNTIADADQACSFAELISCLIKPIRLFTNYKQNRVDSFQVRVNGAVVINDSSKATGIKSFAEYFSSTHSRKLLLVSGANNIEVSAEGRKGSFISYKIYSEKVNLPPTAVIQANTSTGVAPLKVLFSGAQSSDPDGSIAKYEWTFGDGEVGEGSQITHDFANQGSYTVILKVTDNNGAQASRSVNVDAVAPIIPDDPSQSAPAFPASVQQTVAQSFEFLYKGENAIQVGVAENKISQLRASVIRGRVLDEDGAPIAGAEISIPSDPAYGKTHSRMDGYFDFVINGGGVITLEIDRGGYFSAQRQTLASFAEFDSIGDVVLVKPDEKVTKIVQGAPEVQTVTASTVTDADGARTAQVLIPPSTTALIVLADGSSRSLPELNLRITEYTVGDSGPSRMPAALPRTSGYTYAAELSADEALALGAKHVEFSKPVAYYVDNFLNMPVGGIVPVGVYDEVKSQWIPQRNGRVIKILSESAGKAVIDVNGQNSPATTIELNELGVSDDELTKIASLYDSGKSLWRFQTKRFSVVDANWAVRNAATFPSAPPPAPSSGPAPEGGTQKYCASIVEVETQNLGEVIPINNTPFSLRYSAERMPGRLAENNVVIPVTPAAVSSEITGVELEINIAGQVEKKSFGPEPNQKYKYDWNGKDVFGRDVVGRQKAVIKIAYLSTATYATQSDFYKQAFAQFGVDLIDTGVESREPMRLEKTFEVYVGSRRPSVAQSIGGWTLTNHHFYDPVEKVLHMGDGRKVNSRLVGGEVISSLAGTGTAGLAGDGGLAINAQLSAAYGILELSDGTILVSDRTRIRKIDSAGIIRTIAGGGTRSDEGAPALETAIQYGGQLAEGPDGTIYYADAFGFRIRKITPAGQIFTVAGTGASGFSGDGGDAKLARISRTDGVVVAPDGAIYFGDAFNNRIRRIGTDGIINTVIGSGVTGYSPDGTQADEANLNLPILIGMDSSGSIIIAESSNSLVRKVSTSGILTTVAGIRGQFGYSGEGLVATQSRLNSPNCAVVGRDDIVYICNYHGHRISKVTSEGRLVTVAGNGIQGYSGENLSASESRLAYPGIVSIGRSGEIFFTDGLGTRLRKIHSSVNLKNSLISPDGDEVFYFTDSGLHTQTRNLKTGNIVWSFEHDQNNRLVKVKDTFNNITEINRDGVGNPTSITSPYGVVTSLGVDNEGYLTSVANSNNEEHVMAYADGGMLTSFTNPRGAISRFEYDGEGLLTRDISANGGYLALKRIIDAAGSSIVQTTTAEGKLSDNSYSVASSQSTSVIRDPAGVVTTKTYGFGNADTSLLPTGETVRVNSGADPVRGGIVQVPNFTSTSVAGRTSSTSITRQQNRKNGLFDFAETTQVNQNGKISSKTFDTSTRLQRIVSPLGRLSFMQWNTNGQVSGVQQNGLNSAQFTYDSRGRLASTTSGPRSTLFDYDNYGNLSSQTDSLGRPTLYSYNPAGRLSSTTLTDGRVIQYSYDSSNNLTSITPSGRPTHTFSYNLVDLVQSYLSPGPTTTTYGYSLDREIVSMKRPDGSQANYNYVQGTSRLASIQTPLGNYDYTYFANSGLVSRVSSPDGVYTYMNYLGSRLSSENFSWPFSGTVQFNYSNILMLNGISVNGQSISIGYNSDDQVTAVGALSLYYHPTTSLLTGTSLLSTSDSHTYNNFGETIAYSAATSGSNLYSASYTRDNGGRIAQKIESILGQNSTYEYAYDLAGRLTGVKKDGTVVGIYGYDSNSNRTSADVRGETHTGTVDSQDRLLSYGNKDYEYSPNGDLARVTDRNSGAQTQLAYDILGNLKRVQLPDGKLIEYIIDGRNRRVAKKVNGSITNGFIYEDQLRIAAEVNPSGVIVSRFVYGSKVNTPDYMIKNGVTYKIISDQLGSPKIVLNASTGVVAQQMEFDEFGQLLVDSNPGFQPFGFAGGLYDGHTKLTRFGARDYDAETGRWTSKDPILFAGGDTNLFGYVANDPINGIDPTGLYEVCTRPLSGFDNERGPLFHQYLCANGACGGQEPIGNPFSSPGRDSNDPAPGSTGVSCQKGPEDNKSCMDKCIASSIGGSRPNYSVINVGGSNCQKWANDTVSQCAAQCGGK